MTKSLDEATATEQGAISTFDSLIKAKTDEVNALTAAIEDKTRRVGELGVSIVQMKGDLSDSEEALIADTKFLAELKKSCSTKEAEWAIIVKSRSEEMLALADTIKILNDDDAKEGIATLTSDIEALNEGIVALDKSVAEATEQRKEENDDYKTLIQSNSAAKDILAFAKNRLNKFYNPKLYKPDGAASFMQISAHGAADPGPAPEAPKAFKKNSEGGTGVIAMIDLLIKDLDTEITEAETEEKLAQEEYEELMADSAAKRASDSKSVTEKEGVKANTEASLAADESELKDTKGELMATMEYEASLHAECDWLIKYFDMRKEARAGEIDSMKKAKAVLSGADFSLVQTKEARFLGRA